MPDGDLFHREQQVTSSFLQHSVNDSEQAAASAALNHFLAGVWAARQRELVERASLALDELRRQTEWIRGFRELRLELQPPPGLRCTNLPAAAQEELEICLPLEGTWSLAVQVEVERSLPLLGNHHTLAIQLRDLRIHAALQARRTRRTEAELLRHSRLHVDFEVELETPDSGSKTPLLQLLLETAELVARHVARGQAEAALQELLPHPEAEEIRQLGLAPAAPAVADPALPVDLEGTARTLSAHILAEHMPWNTVLGLRLSAPRVKAAPASFVQFQDSAIWTGHYLAAEVLHFVVTREDEAASAVERALDGLETLTRLTVDPGQLCRVRVPLASPVLEALELDIERRGKAEWLFNSREPVTGGGSLATSSIVDPGDSVRALGHITRDQYAGAFLGAGLAALLLEPGEPDDHITQLRERARQLVLAMAGYLLNNGWSPAEVRLDADEPPSSSVTYGFSPTQVLYILHLAQRLDPDSFADAYGRIADAAPCLWWFSWLQTLDPHNRYYKFNLEHGLALLLLAEDNPEQRAQMALPLRVLRRALRYHDNAWFNLVELALFGETPALLSRPRSELEHEVRGQLALWLQRSRIFQPFDHRGDTSLETVRYPGLSGGGKERISRQPLPVDARPSTDFLWQRSPFKLVGDLAVPRDIGIRPPGVDFVLVYWLARRLGVVQAL